ncbi:MAG: hypothetical protein QHC67_04575 [Sphingobium sp.]|uniref:hypothetical protein n=1 Tax=Sphingobium sp. TaxID=1912891 RepID=UPI0029A3CD33|nr:hypothetical protein [Sphingobium sp.]MDX3909075.1 hypothetical protein [Sphingobium sp.]
MLKTCFVIQRFDGGAYDRRYRETFAPAIDAAGAKPIRADEVLGTTPVIEKIEAGIRNSTVAFADVSEDNPNVFLELGYALCLNVPTVIVCDKSKRVKLPFDISHRPIIFYSTDAQSDFENLAAAITENIRVALSEAQERTSLGDTSSIDGENADFDDLKRACLLEFLDQDLRSPEGTTLWSIQRKIVDSFASERMVALVTARLIEDGFVQKFDSYDENTHERYIGLSLTDTGRNHLLRSYAALMKSERDDIRSGKVFEEEDEVPF